MERTMPRVPVAVGFRSIIVAAHKLMQGRLRLPLQWNVADEFARVLQTIALDGVLTLATTQGSVMARTSLDWLAGGKKRTEEEMTQFIMKNTSV